MYRTTPSRLDARTLVVLGLLLGVAATGAWGEKSRFPIPTPSIQAAVSRIFEVVSLIRHKFLFRVDMPQCLTAALDAVCADTSEHRISDWDARHLDWNTFRTRFVTIAMHHPDHVESLTRTAIRAFMEELDDPYTCYVPREEYRLLQAQESGHGFAGLGVEVAPSRIGLRVVASLEGSPARSRGIHAGDEITIIDGRSLAGLGFDRSSDLLLGPVGSSVRLVLRSVDGRTRQFEVKRARVVLPPVRTHYLSTHPAVACVRISIFSPATSQQTRTALERFAHDGIAGLVVDLRDNPGGRMVSALGIAGLLAPGRVLVKVQRRGMPEEVHMAPGTPRASLPMVVLVNQGTASSAELVAGALQDANLATVVGQRTFGKGHIQTLVPLSDGAAIRITSARYTTPAGHDVNGRGIQPDVCVPDDDTALDRALHIIMRKLRSTRA